MTGLPLLQKYLTTPDAPYLNLAAAQSMAPRPGGPPPDPTWMKVVRELSAHSDPAVRVQAAAIVAPYDLELARRATERALADGSEAVRELAAKAMIESIATDFTTLRGLLRANSSLTRVRAANAILRLTK